MSAGLNPKRLEGRRRVAAYIALGALVVLVIDVLTFGFGMAGGGGNLLGTLIGVAVRMGVLVAGAWWAITTRTTWKRVVAAVISGIAALSIVGDLVRLTFENLGGLITAAVALVIFVLAAGRALGNRDLAENGPPAVAGSRPAASRPIAQLLPARQVRRRFARPVLLVNPQSGRGGEQPKRTRLSGLTAAAWRHGVEVRHLPPGHDLATFAKQAIEDGADALGVAGGDGSVAAVASVAIGYGVPLVAVPAGTHNHFARDLGLDRSTPAAALDAFVTGEERRVDVGVVQGRLFLNNVSVGVYATLVHTPTYRDDRLSVINSLLPGVLRGDHPPVKLHFTGPDGRVWDHALVLLVSNNAYPITGFGSRPRLDAGQLQVSVLQPADGADYAKALGQAAAQYTASGEHWARWGASTFRVDSPDGRIAVGIDGEPFELDTPLEFQIIPGALKMLVPPASPEASSRLRRLNQYLTPQTVRQLLDAAGVRLDGRAAASGWRSGPGRPTMPPGGPPPGGHAPRASHGHGGTNPPPG
jgi:diacylglycerol kinase family enzyme